MDVLPLFVASPKYQQDYPTHQTPNDREIEQLLPPQAPGYLQGIYGTLEIKKYGGLGKRPRWKLRHVAFQAKHCLFIYSQSYVVFHEADIFFLRLTD